MSEFLRCVAVIAVTALMTYGLRALPFLVFGGHPLPKAVQYLGRVLPPAIMTVLVAYCLRDIQFRAFPFGLPELISCALVVILQNWRKNMYLSIIAGTVCYMVLIRIL